MYHFSPLELCHVSDWLLLTLGFHQFDYDTPTCNKFYLRLSCLEFAKLEYLSLCILKIWGVFSHQFLLYVFCLIISLCFYKSITHVVDFFLLTQRSLRCSSFCFKSFISLLQTRYFLFLYFLVHGFFFLCLLQSAVRITLHFFFIIFILFCYSPSAHSLCYV